MGCLDCLLSKPLPGDSVEFTQHRSNDPYTPQTMKPPSFACFHNESCRILGPWENDWEKSRNYRYVIYYIDNALLPNNKKQAQDRVLEHISQLADVHQLNVWVKCLDYTSKANQGSKAEDAKNLYQNMLEATSRLDLIQLWDTKPDHMETLKAPSNLVIQSRPTGREEIDSVIETLRKETGFDDLDAKSQIEPPIVAALSTFNQGWMLKDFLENKQTVFNDLEPVKADGGSKLQAQFFLQCRATFNSLTLDSRAKPTVTINLLPDVIANDVASTIEKHLAVVDIPLKMRVDEAESATRQDRSGIQLISFGNNYKGGAQWSRFDDRNKGGMDITDHLHLNIRTLESMGLGPWFGPKAMLGSVDHDVDRASKKQAKSQALYGTRSSQVTMTEMERCVCRNSPDRATDQINQPGKVTGS
ncbi:hypothetical protein EDB81DRAFT_914380 [Dactylonectria macrodidyma]|uniref:Uncharacterized protein n=1 Tax=Dactylonectria macrodidyma TaxID=307937 RepID=A0A9P9DKI8_9HYPO|nr:hypothetical protein EDB81DRAFT_914380 [Dactylonectria macrodidyma]